MKKTVIRNAQGKIRNIGPWDYQWEPVEKLKQVQVSDEKGRLLFLHPIGAGEFEPRPEISDKPFLVEMMVPVMDDEGKPVMRAANPMPDDHYEDEAELQEGADGELYENYQALRRVAYPSIADQLDAIWKGGADMEAMRTTIMGIKDKYKK